MNPHRVIPLYIFYVLPTVIYFLSIVLQAGLILNKIITFSPLDSEKTIKFNIADDIIALEPPEKFTLTLTAVTISDGIMLQPSDKTYITILDEDGKCSHHFIISKRIILPINFVSTL